MKKVFVSEKYGNITYEESVWSGKKKVYVNGVVATQINKLSFSFKHEEENIEVIVYGNIFKGCTLKVGEERYEIYAKSLWYEYVLAILPFVFIMIWGNIPPLCEIIPVIGGAIGGAISGVMGVVSISFMKNTKNVLFKLLIGIGFFLVTVLICAGLGLALVNVLN